MGRNVIVRPSLDEEVIKELFLSCWETISEDGQDPEDWRPRFEREGYLIAWDEHEPVALLSTTSANASILHAHIHIPPEKRDKKYEAGEAILNYIWDNTEFLSIVVYIPAIYQNVIGFVKKMGFVNVGCVRRSYRKNGQIHDLEILQVERFTQ